VLFYFKNDSKGLLSHMNPALRELAGLALHKSNQNMLKTFTKPSHLRDGTAKHGPFEPASAQMY